MYFQLFVGVLSLSLFYYASLCVHSSFAIILKRQRKLVALLLLSHKCIVTKMFCGSYSRCRGLAAVCVFVVVPDHTHLLFDAEHQASGKSHTFYLLGESI